VAVLSKKCHRFSVVHSMMGYQILSRSRGAGSSSSFVGGCYCRVEFYNNVLTAAYENEMNVENYRFYDKSYKLVHCHIVILYCNLSMYSTV